MQKINPTKGNSTTTPSPLPRPAQAAQRNMNLSVDIPRYVEVRRDDTGERFVAFEVRAASPTLSQQQAVLRRFSDFLQVSAALVAQGQPPLKLPGKQLFQSEQALEARRLALQSALREYIVQQLPPPLFAFLGLSSSRAASSSRGGRAGVALPPPHHTVQATRPAASGATLPAASAEAQAESEAAEQDDGPEPTFLSAIEAVTARALARRHFELGADLLAMARRMHIAAGVLFLSAGLVTFLAHRRNAVRLRSFLLGLACAVLAAGSRVARRGSRQQEYRLRVDVNHQVLGLDPDAEEATDEQDRAALVAWIGKHFVPTRIAPAGTPAPVPSPPATTEAHPAAADLEPEPKTASAMAPLPDLAQHLEHIDKLEEEGNAQAALQASRELVQRERSSGSFPDEQACYRFARSVYNVPSRSTGGERQAVVTRRGAGTASRDGGQDRFLAHAQMARDSGECARRAAGNHQGKGGEFSCV